MVRDINLLESERPLVTIVLLTDVIEITRI